MALKKERIILDKKYEFTGKTLYFQNQTLHQIVAIRDIPTPFALIKAGMLGGYIENESNLSHEDGCWLEEDSRILRNAVVSGYIYVRGSSIIDSGCVLEGMGIVENSKLQDVLLNGVEVILKNMSMNHSTLYGTVEINEGSIESCEIIHSGGLKMQLINCYILNSVSGTRLLIKNEDEKELVIEDSQILFTGKANRYRKINGYGKIEGFIGSDIHDIDLSGWLFITHVHAKDCSFVTNRMNEFISIRGSEEEPVKIQNGRVFMRNASIEGLGIMIDGYVCLSSVEMYHHASVKNVLDEALEVVDTKIQDCSSLLKENYNDELVESLHLQNDDVYVI